MTLLLVKCFFCYPSHLKWTSSELWRLSDG